MGLIFAGRLIADEYMPLHERRLEALLVGRQRNGIHAYFCDEIVDALPDPIRRTLLCFSITCMS